MHNNLKKKKVQQKLYYQTAGKKYSFSNELAGFRNGNKAGRVSKTTLLAVAKNKIFLHTKKAFCLNQKRYWFYDNAAPIPGVSLRSVKKRKALG
jgi:hypothetical protein